MDQDQENSTDDAFTEMDITPDKTYGSCDLKCAYSFVYTEINSFNGTNSGYRIKMTSFEDPKVPPVTYNTLPYNVSDIYIYSPSFHLYNGTHADAELIVKHTPRSSGGNLYVCIPMISSSETSTATNMITQLINEMATRAPSSDAGTIEINIDGFNLQKIIPNKPFYSYTNGDSSDDMAGEYVLFGRISAIPLTAETVSSVSKIIESPALPIKRQDLYVNASGPNSSKGNDGIYISCQPTGSSDETVDIVNTTQPLDLKKMFNNPIVILLLQILGICCFFVFLILCIYLLRKFVLKRVEMTMVQRKIETQLVKATKELLATNSPYNTGVGML